MPRRHPRPALGRAHRRITIETQSAADPGTSDAVILLHGLNRTLASMRPLGRKLAQRGYGVINAGYPSAAAPVEDLAAAVLPAALGAASRYRRIHFVTHSMGGILLRAYSQVQDLPDTGRIVMLAPPNGGSEIVDLFRHWETFRRITGPAGRQLGTSGSCLPARLPRHIGPQVGVIAGTRPLNPAYAPLFSGPNDGKVTTASAFRISARACLELPLNHTLIMLSPAASDAAQQFLSTGAFAPAERASG